RPTTGLSRSISGLDLKLRGCLTRLFGRGNGQVPSCARLGPFDFPLGFARGFGKDRAGSRDARPHTSKAHKQKNLRVALPRGDAEDLKWKPESRCRNVASHGPFVPRWTQAHRRGGRL